MQAPDATWLGPWPSGWSIEHLAETGSTNADLLAAAGAGAPHRSVLAADHQTAGRGRLDRSWEAPPGANLLVSLLFREDLCEPHRWTQRVALAAARACEAVAGTRPTLKWPNDLLLGEAKLAGILAQAGSRGGIVDHVVVGLGLNVEWAPPGAARLGRGTPALVLRHLLDALDRLPAQSFDDYRRALDTLGRQVRVELPGETLLGEAIDVLENGALVVEGPGGRRVVHVGDVVHLRVTNG
jgi:BirA family biotin operon repressor/biotin-[acetyl-CoA-carboxylase] ligase